MTEVDIRSIRCPRCRELPSLVVGDRQAFCGTEGCPVFTWDLSQDAATFEATVQTIELPPALLLVVEDEPPAEPER